MNLRKTVCASVDLIQWVHYKLQKRYSKSLLTVSTHTYKWD